jgi:prevent-host-death family protein
MATTVNVHEAKTKLSKLLLAAERGEEIIIARNGKPAVRLQPLAKRKAPRLKVGFLKGKIKIHPDFYKPMPAAELERWYGSPLPRTLR